MNDKPTVIEVYEWEEGRPRPGTVRKPRRDCIDVLEVPPDGLPNVGDVVLLSNSLRPTPYRVVSREFLWGRVSDDAAPAQYYKMWIHVRRLTQEEWEADEQSST